MVSQFVAASSWHYTHGFASFVLWVFPMKIIFGIAALFVPAAVLTATEVFPKFTLETENHIIEITSRCPEGYVTCDRVIYKDVNKKTGAAITLRGETMHHPCADGVTPCRFLGYRFRNGKHVYYVWEGADGEQGTLEVRVGRQTLLTERGTWN